MTWSLSEEQRNDTAARMADGLLNLAFAAEKEAGDVVARAKAIEKRAYSAVLALSSTTTGTRPDVELRKIYAYEVAKLMQADLLEAASAQAQSAAKAGPAHLFDLSLTAREFVSKERAEELLEPLLQANTQITSVKLSTKSFGKDAAQIAALAFTQLGPKLLDLDLSDSIAGRPEEEAKGSLKIMCDALVDPVKLRSLTISDNALGEKGVRACGTALTKQTGLQRLTLENVGASAQALSALSELLAAKAELRQLHLWNGMSGDDGAVNLCPLLEAAGQLEDFKFGYSRVASRGGVAVATALGKTSGLVRLDLTGNTMGPDTGIALAQSLSRHTRLRALLLNDAQMTDKGVGALAAALHQSAPDLEEIDLGGNELTPKVGPALAQLVAGKAKLTVFRAPDNELGDKGVYSIAEGVFHCQSAQLRELVFDTNEVRDKGAMAMAQAAAAKKVAKLGLNGNMISGKCVASIRAGLKEALGKEDVLGGMSDNDEDADADDDEDEDEEDKGDVAVDLGKARLS